MKKHIHLFYSLLLLLIFTGNAFAQLQSPEQFLGYELGDRFTPHHKVLSYVSHVAEQSDRVTLQKYGETYEHRDLVYLVVTSPQNHTSIEEIRQNNLKLTGLEPGEPTQNQKAIVWLSYNVHGNETSSSEAAMKTLYELVRSGNRSARTWLDDTVVIMDPMLNPDGRDRYVNWFNGMVGTQFNPDSDAREHREPWPGGRSNHYYFDMNRDWAWQTQKETQQRIPIYQQWMPHVHVDFHEQGYNSPYYFAPAAEPFHLAITDWQREFQTTIGENNIRYFDEEGWHYFTRERFDLFYPSYGDTWPTFNGSIGMTYEQAGGGIAGLGIETQEGDTLTLKDRLTHHHITGISTVEVTAQNAQRVISEFASYFDNAVSNAPGRYKTFVVSADNHPDKVYNLLRYLDNQQIEYGTGSASHTADGFDYATGQNGRFTVQPGDILINTHQPNGQLARALFEPNPELVDSLTYDITSWEFHYSRGLRGYALESGINPQVNVSPSGYRSWGVSGAENPYAYLVRWNSMDDARFLAEITDNGVKSRFSTVDFQVEGESYPKGTLVITRNNNSHLGNSFDEIITQAAENNGRRVHGSSTGFVASGSDFGSSNVQFIEKPEIAVLMGEGTSSLNAGEIWHFFDQQLKYPATLLDTGSLGRVDFSSYNVLVLPSGSYRDVLTDEMIAEITSWVQSGGTLISIGETNSLLAGRNGFLLQQKLSEAEEPSNESKLAPFAESSRRFISTTTSGATFNVKLDTTHPLAFGYGEDYFSLKLNADAYEYLDGGWNVGTLQPQAHRSGFVGSEAQPRLEHSLVFGVQPYGSGQVVYMIDNPLFRGFWENGKLLFVNALFFVNNL
ncbi:MAG: M14 metallopeptidase family protein [Balneolaceae bacterium]